MPSVWGIHNDQPSLDLIGEGFISIGWDAVGDLSLIGNDRPSLKKKLILSRPGAKPGAIPVWAGVLARFAFEMQIGDYVVSPQKADSTVSIGRIVGDYYWDETAAVHRNRRQVEWLQSGLARASFSKSARNEIGSAVTLFLVKNHANEFLNRVGVGSPVVPSTMASDDHALAEAEAEPNADGIEEFTRDFVIDTLKNSLDPYEFEHFVAELIEAMGYRARVTQASADGGVDIVAHRDPLGLEPPIIKVQCKQMLSAIGAPEVKKLAGTLAPGGTELGLFVTLGTYTSEAIHFERERQHLRLINGKDLVDLVFEHYDGLPAERKRLLPMRRVFVVDREPEVGLAAD